MSRYAKLTLYDLYEKQSIARLTVALGIALAQRIEHIHARGIGDFAEYSMFAVEMRRRPIGDEELRPVGIASGIGH